MKTTRLIAAIALTFAAMTATAEKKPVVKVIDSYSNGDAYYVEYTINGTKFRSDKTGYLINQKAWKYMSDDDRMKTVKAVTYVWDARQEQFGDLAFEMGRWYDEKMGWTEAAATLQERLVKKYHPELWDRFSPGKVEEYVRDHVRPAGVPEDEGYSNYPDLWLKNRAMNALFDMATSVYNTLGPAEYRRTEAAVKSTSGDLIQLICDRVLVPNITPSGMLSGIEAIPSKILGSVFDMANTLSGAQDKLVEKVVGERTTAAKARLVIDNANSAIAVNKKIITTCMNGVQSLRADIEREYPALKEAHEKREKEVIDAYDAKLAAARGDGEDISCAYVEGDRRYQELYNAWVSAKDHYFKVCAETSSDPSGEANQRREQAEKKMDEAERTFYYYKASLEEWVTSAWKSYTAKYLGSYTTYRQANELGGLLGERIRELKKLISETPTIENDEGASGLAHSILWGWSWPAFEKISQSDVSAAESIIKQYIVDAKKWRKKRQEFFAASFSVLSEAYHEYVSIVKMPVGLSNDYDYENDWWTGVAKRFLDAFAAGRGVSFSTDIEQHLASCTGPEEHYSEDDEPQYKLYEIRLNDFLAAYGEYAKRQKEKQDFVDEWQAVLDQLATTFKNKQHEFDVYGSTLPIYITEQNIGGNSLVILNENSILGKEFLPPNGTADAAKANAYRQELDSYVAKRDELYVDLKVAENNLDIAQKYMSKMYSSNGDAIKSQKKVAVKKAAKSESSMRLPRTWPS